MELILEPGRAERNYWRDLWRYRELFYVLAWRDVAVRYRQTVIGVLWALIRPVLTMVVFTVVFGKFAALPAPAHVPYALLVYAGVLPWQFFANALSDASDSLIANSNLVSKVYFPRLIIPAGSVITSMVDFLISFAVLAAMMAWFRFTPDWRALTVPLFFALAFALAMGIGVWFCALNVEYRDFRYIVPFMVQFGLFISPVGFSSGLVPTRWRLLYSLNPMVGVIDGFRWALLRGERELYGPGVFVSTLLTAAILVSGVRYFRNVERTFSDVI